MTIAQLTLARRKIERLRTLGLSAHRIRVQLGLGCSDSTIRYRLRCWAAEAERISSPSAPSRRQRDKARRLERSYAADDAREG